MDKLGTHAEHLIVFYSGLPFCSWPEKLVIFRALESIKMPEILKESQMTGLDVVEGLENQAFEGCHALRDLFRHCGT